jgi:hypothetical protein
LSCHREISYTCTPKVFEENLPFAKLRKRKLRGSKGIWPISFILTDGGLGSGVVEIVPSTAKKRVLLFYYYCVICSTTTLGMYSCKGTSEGLTRRETDETNRYAVA